MRLLDICNLSEVNSVKGKPPDTFEATESIPEGRAYAFGDDVDYSIEAGEFRATKKMILLK